jgi:hypothetical protein
LVKNFSLLSEVFGKMADASVAQSMFRGLYFGKGLEEFDAKIAKQKEDALKLLKTGFVGMEPIPERDFKFDRDMYGLRTNLKGAFAELNTSVWPTAGKNMAEAFAKHFKEMSPLAAAFDIFKTSPIWKTLGDALNFALPPDAAGKLSEYFLKMLKPQTETEDNAGSPTGVSGPGFTFKQSSAARYEFGGPEMLGLDYQQLVELKLINRNLIGLIQANGGVIVGGRDGSPSIKWKED